MQTTPDARLEARDPETGEWGTMIHHVDAWRRTILREKPTDEYRLVVNEPTRDAVGTAYLDPATGEVYRLTGYDRDWGTNTERPSYSVLLPEGAQTRARNLPVGATPIWSPAA